MLDRDEPQWSKIYNFFIINLFTPREAEWAADNNLNPNGIKAAQIAKIVRNRKALVKVLMKHFKYSLRRAILEAENQIKKQAEYEGKDPDNVFLTVSP